MQAQVMAGLLMIAQAAVSQAPSPSVQTPIGDSGWIAIQEAGTCKIARRFDGEETSLTIALQGAQILSGPSIQLIEDGKLAKMATMGSVKIAVLPDGDTEELTYGIGIDPATKRRHIEINSVVPLFLQMASATTVQFRFGPRPPVSIPAAGMDAALKVFRACQRRETVARGLDMAKIDAIAVPARPVDPSKPYLWSQSYPPEARRNNRMGDVEIAWTVDVTGMPRDCTVVKSSGTKSLDDASCVAVMKAARYRPALDGTGKPVEMPQWTRIKWQLLR